MGASGECTPFHSEVLTFGADDFRIFRCDWGWCVKRGDEAFRSRLLLDALEQAYRQRLEQPLLREVVGAIERALEAEHARTGRTASTVVAADDPRRKTPPLGSPVETPS